MLPHTHTTNAVIHPLCCSTANQFPFLITIQQTFAPCSSVGIQFHWIFPLVVTCTFCPTIQMTHHPKIGLAMFTQKKMSKKYEHFLNKSANFGGTSSKFNTIPLTKFNIFSHWMAKSRFQCWILVRDQSWEKNSIKSSLNLIDNTFPLKWMAIQIMDDPD